MFLWHHISHINEPDIYILSHIYANSKGLDKPAVYVVCQCLFCPLRTKYRRPLIPLDWCACIIRMCNPNNHKLLMNMNADNIYILFNFFLTNGDVLHVLIAFPNRLDIVSELIWIQNG